jgi:lipopolysaccharide/colanic/teichoic acid biosynthesis glycosyltransferase
MVDIVGGVLGCLVLFVITPFVALAIKIEDSGPIFIKCRRISEGRTIEIYKYRTMICGAREREDSVRHMNERNDGPFFKIRNNPALTKVGKFLRKFKIDELPQVINVLNGELSLIGPRPHEPEEIIQYPLEYLCVPMARAGMTGLPQAISANHLPFKKELELDRHYLKNQSIWLDTKIIAKTAKVAFMGEGI